MSIYKREVDNTVKIHCKIGTSRANDVSELKKYLNDISSQLNKDEVVISFIGSESVSTPTITTLLGYLNRTKNTKKRLSIIADPKKQSAIYKCIANQPNVQLYEKPIDYHRKVTASKKVESILGQKLQPEEGKSKLIQEVDALLSQINLSEL